MWLTSGLALPSDLQARFTCQTAKYHYNKGMGFQVQQPENISLRKINTSMKMQSQIYDRALFFDSNAGKADNTCSMRKSRIAKEVQRQETVTTSPVDQTMWTNARMLVATLKKMSDLWRILANE